jgi:hypothetical protein
MSDRVVAMRAGWANRTPVQVTSMISAGGRRCDWRRRASRVPPPTRSWPPLRELRRDSPVVESQLLARSVDRAALYEISRSAQWADARFCRNEGVTPTHTYAPMACSLAIRATPLWSYNGSRVVVLRLKRSQVEYLLVFAEVSPLEGSADPPVRGGWDAVSQPGRRRGRRWPGPRHRLILDDQRRVAGSGGTRLVRDRFPFPGKQSGGHRPSLSPGNQQAISFVWCA